jgi:hypothetical protein
MHPVLKTLAVTAAAAGAIIATPASARTYVGLSIGAGYPGYAYAPGPYWGPGSYWGPPAYWGPPVYGYGFGYVPRYRYGWGHRGWHGRHW